MSSDIRAVVFDIGRVMFEWQLSALFEKLIDDPAELEWFLTHVVTEEWHFEADRGASLAEMIPARKALFPDQADLIDAYATRFGETIPGPVPGTLELVRQLHEAGVPLFCLTNFGSEFFADFRKSQPIFDLFEDIVVSGDEKVAKPEPRIYEIVEQRSGCSGSQIFFTDDNISNIQAAQKRGWIAHHFTSAPDLAQKMGELGLI